MNLSVQKRLAASVLSCSEKRVVFDVSNLQKIKEAITKADMRSLANQGIITAAPIKGVSKGRHRHSLGQKRKGRQHGKGTRKGKATSRRPRKEKWMAHIRLQRKILRELRVERKLSKQNFRMLYLKAKGGNFRSKAHLMLYITENNLVGGSQ
ncbi:MAG TPA: 50S ribosomal protein L19e [Candidatus Nanoarchaeia archaeon]|nr:50S ribosomal protein L19e [Candidatus Nanoarchaeia archaeon]